MDNSIMDALNHDTFDALIEDKTFHASRWVLNTINPELRNKGMVAKAERHAQFARTHGGATLKSGEKIIVPSTELVKTTKLHTPIIAIRIFHGGAEAVCNNVAYHLYYGYTRCNLAQDIHLREGVYAYVDIDSALRKLDLSKHFERTKCLGVVEGYLKYKHDDKLCLDARSCKLIAVFLLGVQIFPCHFSLEPRIRCHFAYRPTNRGHH